MPRLDFELTRPQSKAFRIAQKPLTDLNLEWGRGCGKSWFERFIAWTWAARSQGKTRLQLLEELGLLDQLNEKQRRKAAGCRGIRIIFLMPTLKQFKDVHGAAIKDECEQWAHLGPRPNWSEFRIRFPDGGWIMPFPADQHSSQRSRGIRADIVISDESDDIDTSVMDSVVRPWFSEPWSLKIRITGGTYKRGRHGLLYARRLAGLDPAKPRYHTIHATYRDCPEIVDAQEVEDARENTLPAVFAREWECDPDSSEGLVYPFNDDHHIRVPPEGITWSEILIGGDHGWEDPGVLLLIGVIGGGRDAIAWVLDEIHERQKDEDWWVDRAGEWCSAYPNHKFYGDPSMPSRIEAFKRKSGARVREVDNSIFDGVSSVTNMLAIRTREGSGEKHSKLYVHPKCKATIKEFGLYRRKKDPKDADRFLDDIEDRNNHCLAAGTLVETARGQVPIESVVAGDMVFTTAGLRRVTRAWCSGRGVRVLRMRTSCGRQLVGTSEHKVWTTGRGWVSLDALRYDDIVSVWENTGLPSAFDTRAKLSGATLSPQIQTSPATSVANSADIYTGSSGKSGTVLSRLVSMCTTGTVTQPTTFRGTWNAFLAAITPGFMLRTFRPSSASTESSTSTGSDTSPKLGTQAQRGESGMQNMRGRRLPKGFRLLQSVLSAGLGFSRSGDGSRTVSAPMLASQRGGELAGSTTLPVFALDAVPSFRSTDTQRPAVVPSRVVELCAEQQKADVFDLTVEGEHEFFANGVLVHNCMDALRYAIFNRFGPSPGTSPRRFSRHEHRQ